VLVEALRAGGDASAQALRDKLAAVKDFEGVTGKISIDAGRNAQKSAVVLKIENGKPRYEATIAP
jgi:branched-chain amino acid transport system substrate-binding protein